MVDVDGAERDTSKCCLSGTRESILSEIKDWLNRTGEDAQRIFWLSGTAGKGKPAIAHTIASWFDERGGPVACSCFDCTQEAERHREKIFTTIARDLADRDPMIWRTLASAVHDNELRHAKDIARQWKNFILGPVGAASQAVDIPILVVIDALDESGEARSREQILRMLAGNVDPLATELPPRRQFDALVARKSGKGTLLLDDMYRLILEGSMLKLGREDVIPMFCSVMRQILALSEPLPATALNAMRQHLCEDERYDVKSVIRKLGSLVTGTDSIAPVRPLHASLYDFLTDKSRSNEFSVGASLATSDLTFASLRVMERGLWFNICSLESSYLPNSAALDLEERVKKSIPAELSYSCRYWGTHVGATPFQSLLAEEIRAFLDTERPLFWLEALTLMKGLGGSVGTLTSIASWLTVRLSSFNMSNRFLWVMVIGSC